MNLKRKVIGISLILVGLVVACASGEAQEGKNGILSGKLENITPGEIYLIDLANPKGGPVDTAYIDEKGRFAFDFQPASIGFYRLNLSESISLIIPLEAGDKVKLNGSTESVETLELKGSKGAERLKEFNLYLQGIQAKQNALNQEFQQYVNHPKRDSILKEFQGRYGAMEDEKSSFIRDLISSDPGLFANIAIMEQLPTQGQENIETFKAVDAALASKYAESPFYQSFKQRVDNALRFAPGSSVPEISLPNPDGEIVSLSSLRGQVVLIDFWASWCKPCRRENPNVVAAYQKYKDKGFTVFGVSLDRAKDAWVKAIEQDNLSWTHVSDLKFWQSEAAADYGVRGIPFALLIDEEGKVIGKNLRGQALHEKLEEVLN